MTSDAELLRRYAETRSEEAFTELVQRHLAFVYAAALRQVGGSVHRAEDVTQAVFTDVARKAEQLAQRPELIGWLYTSTHFAAAKLKRAEQRRQTHEQEAHAMQQMLSSDGTAAEWERLRPVIDDVMHALPERDREAILLRFFQSCPFAEVGRRLDLSEDAARMRVDRALDKLRDLLAKRHITSTTAALGLLLANQPAVAMPAGLAASVTGAVLVNVVAGGGGAATALSVFKIMSMTKVQFGVAGALLILAFSTAVYEAREARDTRVALTAANQARVDLSERLQKLNQRIADESARTEALQAAVLPPSAPAANAKVGTIGTMEQLRILADLQQRGVLNARITLVSPNGQLGKDFVNLFGLTPAEQATLQQSLDSTRAQLINLQLANATMSKNDKGQYVIAVKPFGEGSGLYDPLLSSFSQTLGPDRNAAFLTLGADQLERVFGHFGAENKTVIIGPNPEANDPNHYQVTDHSVYKTRDAHGHGTDDSSSTTTVRDRDAVVQRFGALAKLLPPDF
jgi:RNA polymerase sigma factor (sigma-70 family)